MTKYPESIQRAIRVLSRLPGIGTKTAERLVFFLIRMDAGHRKEVITSLQDIATRTSVCTKCGYICQEGEQTCAICNDPARSQSLLCIVPDIQTVQAIEKSGSFKGLYHVLGGRINPIEGITSDMLTIAPLEKRLRASKHIKEIILATGTDIEGEQTAMVVAAQCKLEGVTISRLARGIPRGSNLEYTDEVTLADAIKDRKAM